MSLAADGRVTHKLEGKALVARNFFEISTSSAAERRSTISRGGVILTLGLALATVLRSGRSTEANLVGYNLGNVSLLPLIIGPVSRLQASANDDAATFLEIAGDELSLLSPSNDVDEVNGLLTLISL